MIRRGVFLAASWALVAVPVAPAATRSVLPSVTYSNTIQYTPSGPVSLHVITAPRPGGLYALRPALSNDAISGRETVSSVQRRLALQTTAIGINGDFFSWKGGYPSGLLVRGGVLEHHSHPGRSSIGIDPAGTLHVDRVSFSGFWRAAGAAAHPVNALNDPPRARQLALFTPSWGRSTPSAKGTLEVTLKPFPPTLAGADVTGTVAETPHAGPTVIPRDGAVLVARGGSAARALAAEAQPGAQVTVRVSLRPAGWSAVTEALGGGPELVRNGLPIIRSLEQLTPDQLFGRDPRAAVGQRPDGSILLVAVDGRQPWYSVGITNADLARTLVRLGCTTGSAVDSGGSVTVAFNGRVLNRPSDSYGERPVAEALLVTYAGVYAPAPAPVLSPNGDGLGDVERLAYKIVRPSSVSARLVGPGGIANELEAGVKQPGAYTFSWTGAGIDGVAQPEGRWRWQVTATDDLGRASAIDRPFALNSTLGFPALGARRVRSGGALTIAFQLARAATIRVTIESAGGTILRTVASGPRETGRVAVRWDGRDGRRKKLAGGTYLAQVATTNEFGTSQLRLPFRVG